MEHPLVVTLIITVCGFYFVHAVAIKTHYGDVRGFTKNLTFPKAEISIFYGIPYARPPVGELRFRKPQHPTAWTGTLDATQKPNSCPQEIPDFTNFEIAKPFLVTTSLSEDCLYLNVWTPETVVQNSTFIGKRDVIFWLHGGGFSTGSSTLDIHEGTYITSMEKVVFVSINYRLGPLGFLYLGNEEVPGNMALYDMVMALDWVKTNIGAFGGNPESVTIMGVSAGGASVSALLLSPASKGKFKHAFVESGTMLAPWSWKSKQEALKIAQSFSIAAGCSKANSSPWNSENQLPPNVTECMRKIEVNTIHAAVKTLRVSESFDMIMPPTIDGHFFPDLPIEMLTKKSFNRANIMIGQTSKEVAIFIFASPSINDVNALASNQFPRSIMHKMAPKLTELQLDRLQIVYSDWTVADNITRNRDSIVDFMGDTYFVCPSIEFASELSSINNVHYYEFQHISNLNNKIPAWVGAYHGADVAFFLGTVFNKNLGYSEEDEKISRTMMKVLSKFASTGNPSTESDGVTWPEFTAQQPHIYIFGTPSTTIPRSRARGCSYFNENFPNWLLSSRTAKTPTVEEECSALPTNNAIAHGKTMYVLLFNVIVFITVINIY